MKKHLNPVKLFVGLLAVVQCSGCMTMLVPDFVQEEIRQTQAFAKAHPESSHTLVSKDRDVHFEQIGRTQGTKIIFIHGSPGDWGAYVNLLNRKSLQDSALLMSADRLGYGGSSKGGVSRSLEEQARAMMRILDQDDPRQPVILVGHSFGGPVVSKMATFGDPRIRSVVILAGSVDPSLEVTHWYQYPADWIPIRWILPSDLVTCNQEIMALKPELEVMAPEWSKITARVTVVQGLADTLVDPRNADYIESKTMHLGYHKIIRLPGQNHFLQAERNDLIEEILHTELNAISGQGPVSPADESTGIKTSR